MRGNPAPWTPGVPGLSRDWSNERALNRTLEHCSARILAGSFRGFTRVRTFTSHAGQKNRANCTARPTLRPPAAAGPAPLRKAAAPGVPGDCDNLSDGHLLLPR